jgi:hypothetical protein
VDQHADLDPNIHVDADPDLDPDWHQHDADPHANPTPCFTQLAGLQCFIFLMSVKDVIILIILNSIFNFFGKRYS